MEKLTVKGVLIVAGISALTTIVVSLAKEQLAKSKTLAPAATK